MTTTSDRYPNDKAAASSGRTAFTLPYKLFKWADDQEQDEMIEAAQMGRLDEFLEQRYGKRQQTPEAGDGER